MWSFSGTWAWAYQPARERHADSLRLEVKEVGRPMGQVSGTPQARIQALSAPHPSHGVSTSRA
ncbi:hypothetical protein GCM10020254_13040 [Streptomyces goshikiensis]